MSLPAESIDSAAALAVSMERLTTARKAAEQMKEAQSQICSRLVDLGVVLEGIGDGTPGASMTFDLLHHALREDVRRFQTHAGRFVEAWRSAELLWGNVAVERQRPS